MSEPIRVADLPMKPLSGSPCNGCGLCCAAELCQAAEMVIGERAGPCPFMQWNAGRFWCGLVLTEAQAGMKPVIAEALGIGLGCSMSDHAGDISDGLLGMAKFIAEGAPA